MYCSHSGVSKIINDNDNDNGNGNDNDNDNDNDNNNNLWLIGYDIFEMYIQVHVKLPNYCFSFFVFVFAALRVQVHSCRWFTWPRDVSMNLIK